MKLRLMKIGVLAACVAATLTLAACGSGEKEAAPAAPAETITVTETETEPEFDPTTVPETEVPEESDTDIQAFFGEIQKSIKQSWNRCNESDVCIPGEKAFSVDCTRPEEGVMRLECFVSVTKPDAQGYSSGYDVEVTVNDDLSYSWGLAG